MKDGNYMRGSRHFIRRRVVNMSISFSFYRSLCPSPSLIVTRCLITFRALSFVGFHCQFHRCFIYLTINGHDCSVTGGSPHVNKTRRVFCAHNAQLHGGAEHPSVMGTRVLYAWCVYWCDIMNHVFMSVCVCLLVYAIVVLCVRVRAPYVFACACVSVCD